MADFGMITRSPTGERWIDTRTRTMRVFHERTLSGNGSATVPGWVGWRSGFLVNHADTLESSQDVAYIRMSGSTLQWNKVRHARVVFFYYR